ncbi:type III polyketide synthase [Brevibacillus sp. H7]|uniref:type III polyketide synthase n=1 Tax=Brevibacillus sp. H7 TaxID=3349138 RepID=UPI0037F508D1
MPHILAVGTAVPPHEVSQDASMAVSRLLFKNAFSDIDRLLEVFAHSSIRKRHFCMPLDWFQEEHSFAEKNRHYVEHAVTLGAQAIERCLGKAEITPAEIDCLLFVSSTGFSTPSIDARLVNRLGLREDITRIPLWGLGCAGGAMGLSRAFEYALAYPEKRVLLVSVELCGLTFMKQDLSKSNLVATCLFADGAAAVLVGGDRTEKRGTHPLLHFCAAQTTTWKDSLDVMGWELTDYGLKVIFSRDIPTIIKQQMRENVDRFLHFHQSARDRLSHYVLHPGGTKVLTAYQNSLEISRDDTKLAAEVLQEYGNMSSPTVLFVLEKSVDQGWAAGEKGLLAALGPGFSSELVLLEAR